MFNKKLTIAMLSIHSCPMGQPGSRDTGGMNVYVRELSKALGEAGHAVDIYTRAHDPKDAQVEQIYNNVRLVHIRAGSVEDMAKHTQFNHLREFEDNLEAFRRKYDLSYDIIHSHYWLSSEVGRKLAELWGCAHVVMFHTLGFGKNKINVGKPETKQRIETEKMIMKNCTGIITSTGREQDNIIEGYGVAKARLHTVPCGVDLQLFKPVGKTAAKHKLGWTEQEKVILYAGRLEKLKGIDNLIKAFANIENKNSKLLIIGGDEYNTDEASKLKELAKTLHIANRVIFTGSLPQKLLPLYYNAADVCVVPSYYETFCLVILEALACGTPVISSKVGVAADVIRDGDNGYLIENNNPENIKNALDIFFKQNANRYSFLTTDLKEYGWQGIATGIEKIYLKCINEAGGNGKATSRCHGCCAASG